MMKEISESELQKIVERVVRQLIVSSPGSSFNLLDSADINRGQVTSSSEQLPSQSGNVIAIGADHGGFELKEDLKLFIQKQGFQVDDCGTNSADSVDYPDFAYAVAQKVSQGKAWRGIMIDGAGIGSSMAANKVPGIRASMCYDNKTAVNAREHNNANVLTLGAGMIDTNTARQIVLTWLNTTFGGGRHARRVDKIMKIEQKGN